MRRHLSAPLILILPLVLAAAACTGDKMQVDTATTTDATTGDTSATDASTSDPTLTGTSTSTTTGDESTSTTDGCSFIDCQTTGSSPTQCDPGLQDCPMGEKCTPYVMTEGACCVDALKCVPTIDDKQYGEKCTRTEDNDDCDVGLFCMTKASGSTGEGVCLKLCTVMEPGTCPEGECIAFNDGFLPLCEIACDPLVQDCVGDGFGCYAVLSNDKFICAQSGFDDGEGNDGDDCYTIQSCKPGLVCLSGSVQEGCFGERCCTPVCDLTGDGTECIAPSEQCISPWAEGEAPPQYQEVGLCLIPE
ncbi:MAG: hypothetical protein IPK80_22920 [Nannocystis sp.]|nr:hypothetical protein [Nannocystis sp.]